MNSEGERSPPGTKNLNLYESRARRLANSFSSEQVDWEDVYPLFYSLLSSLVKSKLFKRGVNLDDDAVGEIVNESVARFYQYFKVSTFATVAAEERHVRFSSFVAKIVTCAISDYINWSEVGNW